MAGKFHINNSNDDFLKELGSYVVEQSKNSIDDHGYFSIAFSGGSAATKICQCIEIKEYSNAIDFSKWKLFFCDERFVPLDHADSNYKAIHDGMITKQDSIKVENVFHINMNVRSIKEAADDYENKMKDVFKECTFPKIDLVVLGMGPDGHICSLFPNHELLNEQQRWISYLEDSPKSPPQRITFSLNVVNNAKEVIFIATGEGKAVKVKEAIEGEPTKDVPASLVKPIQGNLHWFMDQGSSSQLTQK